MNLQMKRKNIKIDSKENKLLISLYIFQIKLIKTLFILILIANQTYEIVNMHYFYIGVLDTILINHSLNTIGLD